MRVFGELQQLVATLFHELKPGELDPELVRLAPLGITVVISAAERLSEERRKLLNEYLLAMRKFWQVRGTVDLVFSDNVSKQMDEVNNALTHLVKLLSQRDPPFTEAEQLARMNNFAAKRRLAINAIRKELSI